MASESLAANHNSGDATSVGPRLNSGKTRNCGRVGATYENFHEHEVGDSQGAPSGVRVGDCSKIGSPMKDD